MSGQRFRKFTPDEDAMILDAHVSGRKVSVPGRDYHTLRGRLALLLSRLGEAPEPLWRRWSQAELLVCWKMHLDGKSNADVAGAIGRTEKAVRYKVEQIRRGEVPNPEDGLDDATDDEPIAVETKKKTARHGLSESANSPAKRKCLRCGRLFHSAHAGNRICSGCSIANRAAGLPANFNNAESWG